MALPDLPNGYSFKIKVFDASETTAMPVAGVKTAVRLTVEGPKGAVATRFIDVTDVASRAELRAKVEDEATAMVDRYAKHQNVKNWVEADYPEAIA